MPVTIADIQAASERIRPLAKRTPVLRSRSFDAMTGVEAYFKCENFQTGGAFKIRGATNFLRSIPKADLPRGVVAFSSGNHAQAVAIAARDLGVKATLVMPKDAPKSKLAATRGYGAEIVIYDRFTEDRAAIGKRISEETGATLVPPFDHPWIIAGQGTAVLELIEEVPELDAIVVQIGGGGLMSGSSIVARALRPNMRVIGVEPAAANDAALSLAEGRRVEIAPPDTIADGLRVPQLGELTYSIIRQNVDEVALVDDGQIRDAVKWLLLRMKMLVEPSGAATAAAVMARKLPAHVAKVGIVLSGGNVDFEVLAEF
jgi:threonine dehydratase